MAFAFSIPGPFRSLFQRGKANIEERQAEGRARNKTPPGWYDLDISQVVNRGLVLNVRFQEISKKGKWPMFAVGMFAGYHLIISAVSPLVPEIAELPHVGFSIAMDPTPPAVIAETINADAATYFDIGGGLQADQSLAWLATYRPMPESLSVADLDALTAAIRADLPRFGTDAAKWETVARLSIAPKITRPEKAMAEYGDRLKTGIVAILRDSNVVPVVAHVAGQWSVILFKGADCRVSLGPVPAGCSDHRAAEGIAKEARSIFSMMKPQGA